MKCGNHENGCTWTGPVIDAATHFSTCPVRHSATVVETLEENVKELLTENQALKNKIIELERDTAALRCDAEAYQQSSDFTGSYDYDRSSVIKLSQLISRYLENKPPEIDSNRIYDCVRSCYMDLLRGYNDNPKHYYLDMRMLLATCAASTWFTKKQYGNISKWIREYE